jgi:hypothetical protein
MQVRKSRLQPTCNCKNLGCNLCATRENHSCNTCATREISITTLMQQKILSCDPCETKKKSLLQPTFNCKSLCCKSCATKENHTCDLIVRCSTQLGTSRGRYDEHSSKFSSIVKPRFNRTSRRKPNFRR